MREKERQKGREGEKENGEETERQRENQGHRFPPLSKLPSARSDRSLGGRHSV